MCGLTQARGDVCPWSPQPCSPACIWPSVFSWQQFCVPLFCQAPPGSGTHGKIHLLVFSFPFPICLFFPPQEFGSTKSVPSRCDFLQNLIANGCAGAIENPRSSSSVMKNIPLSSKGSGQSHLDVTQITPQKVALSLRPGESQQLPAPWLHVGGREVELGCRIIESFELEEALKVI